MKISRFRMLLFTALILLNFMSVSTVFAAAKPDIFTFHEEGSYEIDCGSFIAHEDYAVDQRIIVFYDQAGNPIKLQAHIDFNGVLTNLSTGFTLFDPGHTTILLDLQDGSRSQVGLVYRFIVPGVGIVVLDAGKVSFDADGNITFVGGPHQALFGGGDLICAALD